MVILHGNSRDRLALDIIFHFFLVQCDIISDESSRFSSFVVSTAASCAEKLLHRVIRIFTESARRLQQQQLICMFQSIEPLDAVSAIIKCNYLAVRRQVNN